MTLALNESKRSNLVWALFAGIQLREFVWC